jgi:phosphoribosylglycinamide formyltransferase 1
MLVSGTGTILEASLEDGLPVAVVVADRSCRGLEIAERASIPAELIDRSDWGGFGSSFDRVGYTRAVTAVLRSHEIDLVAMAGFGTVLAQPIHDAYPMRILNTHPALLPKFPGWHAVKEALESGAAETGCTVHYAVLVTDAGPVVAQQAVQILPGDTEETLHERIKQVERLLYPATIRKVMDELEEVERTGGGELDTGSRKTGSRETGSRDIGDMKEAAR